MRKYGCRRKDDLPWIFSLQAANVICKSLMKRSLSDLTIFFCLLFLTVFIARFSFNATSIDIQLHDTYFVVDRFSLAVMTFGPLICMVFLPLAALRKFKSFGTNVALIAGLVIVAVICYRAVELQSSYSHQIEALRDEQLPDRSQHLNSIRQTLNWSRGILAAIVLPTTILIYRTVKIWKETHTGPQL